MNVGYVLVPPVLADESDPEANKYPNKREAYLLVIEVMLSGEYNREHLESQVKDTEDERAPEIMSEVLSVARRPVRLTTYPKATSCGRRQPVLIHCVSGGAH